MVGYTKHKNILSQALAALCILIVMVLAVALRGTQVSAVADSTTGNQQVVIRTLQTGDILSAQNEFIQIANNTDEPIDITNWCLNYASGSSTELGSHLACFTPSDSTHKVLLSIGGSATLLSHGYITSYPNTMSDLTFSLSISGSSGHIILVNDTGGVVDKLGWGTAVSPEWAPATAVLQTGYLERKLGVNGFYQDTQNNSDDFLVMTGLPTTLTFGQIQEVSDGCSNLDGFQYDPPDGYAVDDKNDCTPQENTVDTPPNTGSSGEDSSTNNLSIEITELLPNPTGVDNGQEFIELFNPNATQVNLAGYTIVLGSDQDETFKLTDELIGPLSYLVLNNANYDFTLTNTQGKVSIRSPAGVELSGSAPYMAAPEGKSWALVNDKWQYTVIPTPGAINTILSPSASVESDDTSDTLTPCPSGQYRNPDTNRCRKTTSDQDSTLVPCEQGEERNPDTNRCRKITSSTSTSLTPCAEGQERNPDTNRCRNVVNSSPPDADYSVLGANTENSGTNYIMWGLVAVVGLGLAYILWEWRERIKLVAISLWRKVRKSD